MHPVNQIPTLGALAGIFFSDFKTEDGLKVRGQLSTPKNSASSDYTPSRRIFITSSKSPVIGGTVILDIIGQKYLCLDAGDEVRHEHSYKKFKAIPLQYFIDVTRIKTIFDPITKRTNKDVVTTVKTDLACHIEPLRAMEDSLRIATDRYTIVSNYPLLKGDMVQSSEFGQLRVERCDLQLGIYKAETG